MESQQQIQPELQPQPITEVPQGNNFNKILIAVVGVIAIFTTIVGGYWIWTNIQNKKQETSVPTEIPLAEPTLIQDTSKPDQFAGWKTYKNDEVTFTYPPKLAVQPIVIRGSGYGQEFKDTNGKYTLSFSSSGNYNQTTGKPYQTIDEYVGMPYRVKTIVVDGQDARLPLPRAGSENINSVDFFSRDTKSIYTLELQTGQNVTDVSENDVQEGQKLFNRILSTFRFTN